MQETQRTKDVAETGTPWWLGGVGLALALTLGACGGGGNGGGGPITTPTDPADPADSQATRLETLLDQADILQSSNVWSRFTITTPVETTVVPQEAVTCTGTRCTTPLNEQGVTISDLLTPAATGAAPTTPLSMRDGLDTLRTTTELDPTTNRSVPGVELTATVTQTNYGVWGTYGFAALIVGTGALTGTLDDDPVSGTLHVARAYALGDASGSNPAGTGSATWTGPVEAAATTTFERLTGTVRLHVPDLAAPRLGVTVTVPDHAIGPTGGWTDLSLTDGRFATGMPGRDRLEGHFAGPAHEEAWGLFDVTDYVGAFGARRAP